MSISQIVNLELISTSNVTITVYDLFISTVVILVTVVLLRLINAFFKRLEKNDKIDVGVAALINKVISYITWIIILSLLLQTIGVNITVLIASSAALFVGLGFGLQNLFNDFASGLILLFDRSLKVGDVVELNDGTVGKVVNINLRVSEVVNRDNITILVPNSKLVNDNVINWSHNEKLTRFKISVGIAYGSDIQLAERLLLESTLTHSAIKHEPEPIVHFSNFGDSALEFELFFWTTQSFNVENIKSDIRKKIDELFRENKVVISFPQMDVHLYKKE